MAVKIAITGGIGSGKSLACQHLQALNYPVFSCDEIYKEIIISPIYVQKIQEIFPDCIQNGQIDRKLLANIVFNNEEKRKQLNAIAHPLIMQTLFEKMSKAQNNIVFVEVPLLFEGNHEKEFDKVIVVTRDQALRINSIISRDGITAEEAKARMQAQFDYSKLEGNSLENIFILKNDSAPAALKKQIEELLELLQKE